MARKHGGEPGREPHRLPSLAGGTQRGITMDMSGRDDGRRFEMSETQEDGTVRTGGGGGGTQQGHPPKPKPKPPKK